MSALLRSLVRLGRRHGPTLAVLVALAATAYWGHRTGWKAPQVAALWSRAAPAKEDWCDAHNVPDSRCISCHPELAGADAKDWCKEHGVPESKCTVCHPEILTKGEASDWCKEHGVPESQCTLCHPEIAVKGEPPPAAASTTVTLDPTAKVAPNPLTCQSHALRVQFASPAAVGKAGLTLAAVEERPMAATVTGNGEITYDQTRLARVSSRVPGIVWRVEKEIGQAVRQGEFLALVDSVEVGRAKAEFLQTIAFLDLKEKTLQRIRSSTESGFRTQGELQEAEAALRDARIRLFNAQQALANLGLPIRLEEVTGLADEQLAERVRFLGLPEALTQRSDRSPTTATLLPLISPADGVVIAVDVVAGEVIESAKPLLVVADTRRMWARVDVRLENAARLALGQAVHFRPDGNPEETAVGAIAWISTAVDEKTRTLRVRANLENPNGRLRAGAFGSARIVVREAAAAIAVPDEAVHWEGCCHVVFVRLTDEIFQTRKVRLGVKSGGFTEVLVGLLPGEVVATAGSHVLKSEIQKSRLGAGCADE